MYLVGGGGDNILNEELSYLGLFSDLKDDAIMTFICKYQDVDINSEIVFYLNSTD